MPFSRMLRRRVPVLKLGWVVTNRRCVVSVKRPQAFAKRSQSVRKAFAKHSQSVRKASASVRERRKRTVKGELHRTRTDAAFRSVPNPSSRRGVPQRSESVKLRGNSTGRAADAALGRVPNPSSLGEIPQNARRRGVP